MGIDGLFELFLGTLVVYFEFAHAGFHLSHLTLLLSFEEFGLELAAWALVLDLIDEGLQFLRGVETVGNDHCIE